VPLTRAEIVEGICDYLRPWRKRHEEAEVRAGVENLIAFLEKIAADVDQRPRGADVRKQAAAARKALEQLRTELARGPLRRFIGPHIAISQSVEGLDRLDEILANAKQNKFPDPRSKPMQRICAAHADSLIYEFSTKPASGTPDSALPAIASLLFEAVTGQPGHGMKRAVESMIALWRGFDYVPGRVRPARKKPQN
jgi:hypothetical protein